MDILSSILPTKRPEDYCIDFARQVGILAAPYVDPLEDFLIQKAQLLIPSTVESWRSTLKRIESPLVKDLPLMNPFHIGLIVVLYLSTVLIGKQMMKNVKRFEVKQFSLLHNFVLVLLSAYMCGGILWEAYRAKYTLFENRVDHGDTGMAMAKMLWLYYFSKIPEFLDTMIMVVKKNNRQISFLHLYHHSSVFAVFGAILMCTPNGEVYWSAFLNSGIHVIMYGYYFLSALGVKQVAFIKKYITIGQMTQFCLMLFQTSWDGYVFTRDGYDGYPKVLIIGFLCYVFSILLLFANYYIQAQRAARAAKAAAKLVVVADQEKKEKLSVKANGSKKQ